jgi:histidinol-phosphate aminotransferase
VLDIYPSDANFILVKTTGAKAFIIFGDKGIIVRNRTKVELCEGCLRITIGTPGRKQLYCRNLQQYK